MTWVVIGILFLGKGMEGRALDARGNGADSGVEGGSYAEDRI